MLIESEDLSVRMSIKIFHRFFKYNPVTFINFAIFNIELDISKYNLLGRS